MKITIEGALFTPKWATLEKAVGQMLDLKDGRFVRIARNDGGVNYRAPGEYTIEYVTPVRDAVTITLIVRGL